MEGGFDLSHKSGPNGKINAFPLTVSFQARQESWCQVYAPGKRCSLVTSQRGLRRGLSCS